MTTKTKSKAKKASNYEIRGEEGLPEEVKTAGTMAASAIFNSIAVAGSFQKNLAGDNAKPDGLILAVRDQVERVQKGDLREIEAMLVGQAIGLQTIFASLARKAAHMEYLTQYQAHMNLALRAQAQSRATLEALIELKQPRHAATFIKQANVANGPQQVNNGQPQPAPAQEIENAPTKVLGCAPSPTLPATIEELTHERLDT